MQAPSAGNWSLTDARAAEKIEIQVDHAGSRKEIEFHISPDDVPQAVRDAMDELHPGGAFTGAEKEWEGGRLYYELTREVGGHDIEAMFTPSGTLHSEEIGVAEAAVPQVVRDAIMKSYPGAEVTQWEEIRDGKSQITEYHVKLMQDGMNYKVMVTVGGTLKRAVREIPAEIEVPVPLP